MVTVTDTAHLLFKAADAQTVRDALHGFDGRLLAELNASLNGALRGSDDAARDYVRQYRQLTDALLMEGRKAHPEIVVDTDDGRVTIADAHGRPVRAWLGVLEN